MNASTHGLWGTGQVLRKQSPATTQSLYRAIQRLGAPVILLAVTRAMREKGRQFVLGETIKPAFQATTRAKSNGLHSFDMFGEAACTQADSERYFASYARAIESIGNTSQTNDPQPNSGISVKLSALHPRYEVAKTDRVIAELVPRLRALAILAKSAAIGLSIDAEEASRLVLSLSVIEQFWPHPSWWNGTASVWLFRPMAPAPVASSTTYTGWHNSIIARSSFAW